MERLVEQRPVLAPPDEGRVQRPVEIVAPRKPHRLDRPQCVEDGAAAHGEAGRPQGAGEVHEVGGEPARRLGAGIDTGAGVGARAGIESGTGTGTGTGDKPVSECLLGWIGGHDAFHGFRFRAALWPVDVMNGLPCAIHPGCRMVGPPFERVRLLQTILLNPA